MKIPQFITSLFISQTYGYEEVTKTHDILHFITYEQDYVHSLAIDRVKRVKDHDYKKSFLEVEKRDLIPANHSKWFSKSSLKRRVRHIHFLKLKEAIIWG